MSTMNNLLVFGAILICYACQSNAVEITPQAIKAALDKDADELVKSVVKPAFKAISKIIQIDGSTAQEVQAKIQEVNELESKLTRTIDDYKNNLSAKHPTNVPSEKLNQKVEPSQVEIRTIIASGLSELMKLRAAIPPVINLIPMHNIADDLRAAAAVFLPYEQTWPGWAASKVITLDKSYTKYCKHLEDYVRTTVVNKKVSRVMLKIDRLAGKSHILSDNAADPTLKKKFFQMLSKIKSDFLTEIENLHINLCQFSTIDEDIHKLPVLRAFVSAEYEAHYKAKVDVIFRRFLQNANIIMDAANHIGLMMAFIVYDTLLKSDLYSHEWKEVVQQWQPNDELKPDAEITAVISAELLKHFPLYFIPTDTPNLRPSVESQKMKDIIKVLEYTIKHIKHEMKQNAQMTMRKLLDDFYLYLLWKSIEEIVDRQPDESFVKFREHHMDKTQ